MARTRSLSRQVIATVSVGTAAANSFTILAGPLPFGPAVDASGMQKMLATASLMTKGSLRECASGERERGWPSCGPARRAATPEGRRPSPPGELWGLGAHPVARLPAALGWPLAPKPGAGRGSLSLRGGSRGRVRALAQGLSALCRRWSAWCARGTSHRVRPRPSGRRARNASPRPAIANISPRALQASAPAYGEHARRRGSGVAGARSRPGRGCWP